MIKMASKSIHNKILLEMIEILIMIVLANKRIQIKIFMEVIENHN